MDPDACLGEVRRLIERASQSLDRGAKFDSADALRLAELVESLDKWIAGGGFLPAAWRRVQR